MLSLGVGWLARGPQSELGDLEGEGCLLGHCSDGDICGPPHRGKAGERLLTRCVKHSHTANSNVVMSSILYDNMVIVWLLNFIMK